VHCGGSGAFGIHFKGSEAAELCAAQKLFLLQTFFGFPIFSSPERRFVEEVAMTMGELLTLTAAISIAVVYRNLEKS
jgi:hypothetical protein